MQLFIETIKYINISTKYNNVGSKFVLIHDINKPFFKLKIYQFWIQKHFIKLKYNKLKKKKKKLYQIMLLRQQFLSFFQDRLNFLESLHVKRASFIIFFLHTNSLSILPSYSPVTKARLDLLAESGFCHAVTKNSYNL